MQRNIGGVVGIAISALIVHTRLPNYFDTSMAGRVDDQTLDGLQADPLSLQHISSDLGGNTSILISMYCKVLRQTYLIYVPITALALILSLSLTEYSLERSQDGEPRKAPKLTSTLTLQFRDLAFHKIWRRGTP